MQFSKLLLALGLLLSTAASAQFASGVQLQGGGTFGWLLFHTEAALNENGDFHFFDDYPMKGAEGGTVGVGYGFCWCERFRFTPQFDATFLSSTTYQRGAIGQDFEDNVVQRMRCNTLLDLSIKPGVMVGDCLLLAFKAGVSWAYVEHTLKIINDDNLTEIEAENSASKWPVGYVLGAEARVGLTRCLSAFLACDWRNYRSDPTTRGSGTLGDDFYTATTGVRSVSARTFSFGLNWSW